MRRAVAVAVGLALTSAAAASVALARLDTAPDDPAPEDPALYAYAFDGGAVVVDNGVVGESMPLELLGDWSPADRGVHFAGDLAGRQSVAAAKPARGYTLDVDSATTGVGAAVSFRYLAPAGGCFADSVNLTQIGRFAVDTTQVKVQLSKCADQAGATTVECRMAGNVGAATRPVGSPVRLVDGGDYTAQCYKGPDPRTGQATLLLRVVRTDVAGVDDTSSFPVPRTGVMRSTAWLSVANKYPLAPPAKNTDQFVGEVAEVRWCTGESETAVRSCLDGS
jgi:hypothetical protein